jgi:hypothetical protein
MWSAKQPIFRNGSNCITIQSLMSIQIAKYILILVSFFLKKKKYLKVAANANPGTVSTENDVNWNELLAPAPMGIAVMSQLLICSSRVRDFKICNNNRQRGDPFDETPREFPHNFGTNHKRSLRSLHESAHQHGKD